VRRYIQALIADLEADLPLVWGRSVQSIYFGGGTPSLFPAESIDRFLSEVRARLDLSPVVEITLEANPGAIEHDSFAAYAQAGINRVSLGVQSFDDDALNRLGRIHGRHEVDDCLQSMKASGITNFNIDLMFALPGQNIRQAQDDVRRAIAAGPTHISWYQLTLEPNTAFAAQPPALPADDLAWEIQQSGLEILEAAGFAQYEISAFARGDMQCRHNMNYWRFGDFLAIGAGAHGKITMVGEGRVQRYAKQRHPEQYMRGFENGEWLADRRVLGENDLVFEFFLNHLRLRHGFSIDDFCARTGLDWGTAEDRVQQAVEKGLLMVRHGRVTTTELGWEFVNDIQQMFL
jgi:oxygen-independent coproporphyrinogen-3 oxidase